MRVNTIHTDGAYSEKYNVCGIGVYFNRGLEDLDEVSIHSVSNSSVESEYLSILNAIKLSIKRGMKKVNIYNDCTSVIDSINNKSNMETPVHFQYVNEILKYKSQFEIIKFTYVKREHNSAHALSKEGLDSKIKILKSHSS